LKIGEIDFGFPSGQDLPPGKHMLRHEGVNSAANKTFASARSSPATCSELLKRLTTRHDCSLPRLSIPFQAIPQSIRSRAEANVPLQFFPDRVSDRRLTKIRLNGKVGC
jgi:hypothetical protein